MPVGMGRPPSGCAYVPVCACVSKVPFRKEQSNLFGTLLQEIGVLCFICILKFVDMAKMVKNNVVLAYCSSNNCFISLPITPLDTAHNFIYFFLIAL